MQLQSSLASLPPEFWILTALAAIIGLVLGYLIWGRALARNQTIAFELAQARASVDEAGRGRQVLERDLASARDQVRPLADEVDRLKREVARLQARTEMAAQPAAAAAPAAVPAAAASVPVADLTDLRLLKGVGDKLIARLGQLGIHSNRDLAVLTPEEAARTDAELGPFAGRIGRDQLIDQARLLMDGRVTEFEARYGRLERP